MCEVKGPTEYGPHSGPQCTTSLGSDAQYQPSKKSSSI